MKILLIDDDILMLKALGRALLHINPALQVRKLDNPAEFQSVLADFGIPDVIFCDYIMPECSGLEVLEMARRYCPQSLRCLLSGEISLDFSVQVENLAHYYLAKPFTREQLSQVLTAAEQLPILGLSKKERAELGQITCLPILPEVLVNTLGFLRASPPDLEKAAQLISTNPLLAAKLMQVANSAMLGFVSPIHNVNQAVFRLGANLTETVVALYELEMIAAQLPCKRLLADINNRAMKKAELASSYGQKVGFSSTQIEELQIVSLLAAVGEICALQLDEHSFTWPLKEASSISAYLLTLWGFSREVICGQLICHPEHFNSASLTLSHAVLHDCVTKNELSDWKANVQKALFDQELLDTTVAWRKEEGL